MAKRILVPLDQSPVAEIVVPLVAAAARGAGATVRLLLVAPVPQNQVREDRGDDGGAERARTRRAGQRRRAGRQEGRRAGHADAGGPQRPLIVAGTQRDEGRKWLVRKPAWSVSAVAVDLATHQFSLERAGTGRRARVVVDI